MKRKRVNKKTREMKRELRSEKDKLYKECLLLHTISNFWGEILE